MKVLFVASGNSRDGINTIVKNQGESLQKIGIEIEYFQIIGKGLISYLKHINKLKRYLLIKQYNIIHAHYVLSGWVALISGGRKSPLILSLMGDDAYGSYNSYGNLELKSIFLIILSKIIQPFINRIIVKSKNIAETVYVKKRLVIIPNGVDLTTFYKIQKIDARRQLKLEVAKRYLLFISDLSDSRKNFNLLKTVYIESAIPNLEIITPYPIEHDILPLYYNAADVMVFTSTAEGSPNVIKEAMACNCPIVSTDVGDVRWVLGDTKGCYLTSFNPEDVAHKIIEALEFSEKFDRTKGRERIIELGLDSESVAKKIVEVYNKVLH